MKKMVSGFITHIQQRISEKLLFVIVVRIVQLHRTLSEVLFSIAAPYLFCFVDHICNMASKMAKCR
jgi:hypothetical protein